MAISIKEFATSQSVRTVKKKEKTGMKTNAKQRFDDTIKRCESLIDLSRQNTSGDNYRRENFSVMSLSIPSTRHFTSAIQRFTSFSPIR